MVTARSACSRPQHRLSGLCIPHSRHRARPCLRSAPLGRSGREAFGERMSAGCGWRLSVRRDADRRLSAADSLRTYAARRCRPVRALRAGTAVRLVTHGRLLPHQDRQRSSRHTDAPHHRCRRCLDGSLLRPVWHAFCASADNCYLCMDAVCAQKIRRCQTAQASNR